MLPCDFGGEIMRQFKILIIGATASGIGKAYKLNDTSTLLVDSGIICGHEFTASYKYGRIDERSPLSDEAIQLLSKIRECNLIENGDISTPSVSGILAVMLLNSGTQVMFMTEVTSVDKADGGFNVTVFSPDGFETVFVEKIFDTAAKGTFHTLGKSLPYKTEYSAMVTKIRNTEINSEGVYNGAYLKRCRFAGEYIFTVPAASENYIEARRHLHGIWQEYTREVLTDFELDMTAHEFSYTLPEEYTGFSAIVEDGFVFAPSVAYDNILSAFDGGVRL